jgi:DtxR family Mn-dependent transcriptional regulator
MGNKKINLSASMEDYLEAIFNLSAGDKVARSKNIADALSVSRSSVTGALRGLSEKGLINYKPYGYITLTEKGRKAAAGIAKKHSVIKSFFVDVLGVEGSAAQKAACEAEHAFGSDIISRLEGLIEFSKGGNDGGRDIVSEFLEFYMKRTEKAEINQDAEMAVLVDNSVEVVREVRSLNMVEAGSVVRLASIDADHGLRQRLAAMGILPNAEIYVVRNEKRGQVVINVKDSKVVLGRGMSHKVMVL